MTDFEKDFLKKIPTKMLLRAFKLYRTPSTTWYHDEDGNLCKGKTEEWLNSEVPFTFGKFSQYNPHKGKAFTVRYTVLQLKAELDTREHIEPKKRKNQSRNKQNFQ